MKKKNIAIATLAAAISIATLTQAYAGWGQQGQGYHGNGMQGPGPQMQYTQVDPAVKEKLDKFFTDTQDLRKEMVTKRAEQVALMRGDNPDPAAASKLAGELFDLRMTMRQKAEEANVAAYLGPMNGPMNSRMGGGDFGPGNRGGRKGGGYMNQQPGPGYGPGARGNW